MPQNGSDSTNTEDRVMSLRERVNQLRKEHGWSQADLASRVGADPAQISRYEQGRITPSADAVVRIAEAFDVSTDYPLVNDAPTPLPQQRRRPRPPPPSVTVWETISEVLGPLPASPP